MPAAPGVDDESDLDEYTRGRIAALDDGYVAFAGQRDDGFYADVQAIFDLLQLRSGDELHFASDVFEVNTGAVGL